MNWYVLLTFADGTTENMYCTSRDEARERARFYRASMANNGQPLVIGQPLVSALVRRSA